MKLGSKKFKERSRNTFREDVYNLVWRRRRETLSCPSKIVEGSTLSGDATLVSARICLTHQEGSSLSDDAVLALARICLTQEVEGRNLEQGTKTMLKSKESPHWAKKPILARRATTTWLAKRPVQHPDSKGKSLQKVDMFLEILYIFDENAMRILRLGFL